MARSAQFPELSHTDAVSALKWLVATKRIAVREILDALRKRDELVEEIRRRLEALGGEGARFLTSVAALRRPPAAKRRRGKPSAKAVAAWKAQGRYMAAVRRLPKAARAKVRAVRQKSGVAAAIAAAKRLDKRAR